MTNKIKEKMLTLEVLANLYDHLENYRAYWKFDYGTDENGNSGYIIPKENPSEFDTQHVEAIERVMKMLEKLM